MIRLLHPEILWLLAALPPLALWWGRRGRAATILFSSTAVARQAGTARQAAAGRLAVLPRLLALALLIVALARPQLGRPTQEVSVSGVDIMLAVDLSGSMRALDFKLHGQPANRVEVVKSVVKKFIAERPDDRIGAVAFAAFAHLVSPLTLDHDWLEQRVDAMSTDSVQSDGTAIGSAIATAVNHLRGQPGKSRVIILLTDGVNNAGRVSPLMAADLARALGIKVYTIGAGTRGEARMPATDAFGRQVTVPVKVDIDEDTLRQIAGQTGGQYYRATDTDSLANIYDEINRMETTARPVKKFELRAELFYWPLLAGLLALTLELLGTEILRRRLP
ncbi:MAG: VWA domain-containing protein [Verrucomicrobiales bacterium]|jgi:Ca-activated chloride channel family protein|nr:VWA domain-containing protein [Verrucomicrobiales bacterium]